MNNTQLHQGLGEHCLNRFGKPRQSIHTGNENVLDSPVLKFRQRGQPELRGLVLAHPHPQKFLLPGQVHTERQVNRFVHHSPVLPHLDHQGIEVDDGVDRIQAAILPELAFGFDGSAIQVYDTDATLTDWQGLPVVGRKGDTDAIAQCMSADIILLKERTELRGDGKPFGGEEIRIVEEFPTLAIDLEEPTRGNRKPYNLATDWLKRLIRRGRKHRQEILIPQLWVGAIIVMDNLPVHHAVVVREAIEAVGATVVFLPPDSPDLSPIELCWSKLKQLLRSAKARTCETLDQALTKIVNECIAADDAPGWFTHCGLFI